MSVLAVGITHIQVVTLILLCVFTVLFIAIDVLLVLTLHRQNKKMAKETEVLAPDEIEDKQ